MSTPTTDPNIVVLEKSEGYVKYQDLLNGQVWEINGTCNACGLCEVGVVDIYFEPNPNGKEPIKKHYQIWTGVPVGQAGACLDARFGTRPDFPMRPEIKNAHPECQLSGRYL